MTARLCLPYPARILRQKAADVPLITDQIRAIWADMVDTMDAMPGYGLAAVQIGIPLRLAVGRGGTACRADSRATPRTADRPLRLPWGHAPARLVRSAASTIATISSISPAVASE